MSEDCRILQGPKSEIISCLDILIDNAFSFTNEGSVSVNVAKQNEFLLLEIHDTGEGDS